MIIAELKRVKDRAVWSWNGFVHVWRTERSLQQWIWLNVAFGILAFVLPLSGATRGMLLMGGILTLAAECMNTAVERVVDDISSEQRDAAKHAKDAASAAVAITGIAVGVAWVCVIWSWWQGGQI